MGELVANKRLQILSAPRVTVLDGQAAHISTKHGYSRLLGLSVVPTSLGDDDLDLVIDFTASGSSAGGGGDSAVQKETFRATVRSRSTSYFESTLRTSSDLGSFRLFITPTLVPRVSENVHHGAPAALQAAATPISMSLAGADLVETLRTFARIGDFNLVIDGSVKGTVTVELKDVPWDRALETILRINNLGMDVSESETHVFPRRYP